MKERLFRVKSDYRNILVLFLDTCISLSASVASILFVRWVTEPVQGFEFYVLAWALLGALFSVVSYLLLGTYKIVVRHSTLRSVGTLIGAAFLKEMFLTVCVLLRLFRFGTPEYDALMIMADLLVTLALLILARVMAVIVVNDIRDTPDRFIDRVPVMVFGTDDSAVAAVIRLENNSNYNVVGYLTRDRHKVGLVLQDYKSYLLEDEDSLKNLKIQLGFQGILFVNESDAAEEGGRDGLIQMCMRNGLQCMTSPGIDNVGYCMIKRTAMSSPAGDETEFIPDGMSSFARNTKRIIDFVLSSFLLVVFSPLFLICYVAVKCEDGGPAIYRQERIGRFGRPFIIYKFRSMRIDSESAGPALYSGDEDPRLTKVGKFLRNHHLDELPQLFNVWKGDMAFVGHRPERKFFIDKIINLDPRYYYLYQIRPGVTSYSTLKNGYADSMEKMLRRLEFDLYYLRHRSLWFDIKVLWQTFAGIVFGKVF